uniref:KRAB domain-containing protein n=1 Tax=Gopherus evgoodei TaxID=1825980 RepID=A0A8C4YG53_9SAUR
HCEPRGSLTQQPSYCHRELHWDVMKENYALVTSLGEDLCPALRPFVSSSISHTLVLAVFLGSSVLLPPVLDCLEQRLSTRGCARLFQGLHQLS